MPNSATYKSAGVNLEAAEEATESVKKLAKSTFTECVFR
jgi:phosphoribosylaminoimidazole (AIR) synthetase